MYREVPCTLLRASPSVKVLYPQKQEIDVVQISPVIRGIICDRSFLTCQGATADL